MVVFLVVVLKVVKVLNYGLNKNYNKNKGKRNDNNFLVKKNFLVNLKSFSNGFERRIKKNVRNQFFEAINRKKN